MPIIARIYISFVALLGLSSVAGGLWFWQCQNPSRFLIYLALSLLCSLTSDVGRDHNTAEE